MLENYISAILKIRDELLEEETVFTSWSKQKDRGVCLDCLREFKDVGQEE